MPLVPPEGAAVSPLPTAALLLVAIRQLEALDLPRPTATAVLAATGAGRSQAYALRGRVEALLATLLRPPGRPATAEAAPVDGDARHAITAAAYAFLRAHPGAIVEAGARQRYSDGFHRFVLDLLATHRAVSLDAFAEAVGVPLATLKDWLAGGREATRPPSESLASIPSSDPTGPQIETVLSAWKTWQGSFSAFCRHIQHDWRVPFGHDTIRDLLAAYGVRFAKRRSGRSPDEDALRRQFETWYPNAQLVGDGMALNVGVDGQTVTVNVELLVDPASGAVTGASVRDTEDAQAVVEAFEDSVATTGAPPLGVLLDNKPSNHAEAVKEALGDTKIMRATPYRPQNKAHVEGAFGLFQQTVPAIALMLTSPLDIAKQVAALIVATWARALNHRPRRDRGGKSRVELHKDHTPTPEEVARATEALHERIRRQEEARKTRAARQDPLVRGTIATALGRLGFEDPGGELLTGIARYPIDAVVEGIAIVEGKQRARTLPDGADARYLLGCVRNVAEDHEGWEITLALLEERIRARDRVLEAAERERDDLAETIDQVERRVAAYVDRALATTRRLDRFFWLIAAADTVLDEPDRAWHPLFRLAARRVHAMRAVPYRDRLAATRFLAARILPIGA